MPDSDHRSLAVFAHERGDARVRKRIAAFRDNGWEVTGFTFHRVRDQADAPVFWNNVELGTTYNRRYVQRLWAIVKSLGIVWWHRKALARAKVLYAVNVDNALLAWWGIFLTGKDMPLVVEIADIQPAMLGDGMISKVLRAVERKVLNRAALLVTTSPGFVKHYFSPVQKYGGEVFLLENKVYPSRDLPAPGMSNAPVAEGKPWVIGCFGALRCRRSLQLMHELATKLGDRVRIVLRGYPAGTIAEEFHQLLGNLPNFTFEGSYRYPDDLAAMYAGIDLNWAIDETDPNGNSAWLLPNRIYEGGCFATPVIGAKGTETGNWIEERGLGWAIEEPLGENLQAWLERRSVEEWLTIKRRCRASPREYFAGEEDYERLSERLVEL